MIWELCTLPLLTVFMRVFEARVTMDVIRDRRPRFKIGRYTSGFA
jgi:hypothetical protein